MFRELADTWRPPFKPFMLYPPASHRSAWESLDSQWKSQILSSGRSYLHYRYPQILAEDFLDFTQTGNRVRYEEKYFARRRALDALVLAECAENDGEFLTDIINGIFCICEESGWQLPSHNSYIRDTPQLPLPDASRPVLDLFACETGSILATVNYLLGDKLNAFSPLICARIHQELTKRIFQPYLECHFWWMGGGKEPMNNWTIWCTQNILLSVFLTDTDESMRQKVLLKACQSADCFLAGYGEDGCCDEGALYYRHAGLCLFNTLELLNAVTGNHFAVLYQEAKIQNIASYIMNVHIHDKYYVNFADCSPAAGRCSAREFLFARRTGNTDMMRFAAKDFLDGSPETYLLPEENNLYYRLQNAFTIAEIHSYADGRALSVQYPDIYYPSTGLFIARDDAYFLAVKAGSNADSHNHNDTGSFIVCKNGLPLFIDAGVETYTQKTFSAERYDIWTMQSAYHNLPTINGCMQKEGEAYRAVNTSADFSPSLCEIQMDIAPAYPPESGIKHYVRKARLEKSQGIKISDFYSFDKECLEHSVILSLMTYEKPLVTAQSENSLSFQVGETGSVCISGGNLLEIETIPITDKRLQTAWKHEIYRILIAVPDAGMELHIK